MMRAIIVLTAALSACADTEVDQMLSRCWQVAQAPNGAITIAARGVFVPRHGAILLSESCRARMSVSGDAAYQRLDIFSADKLSTTPTPFAAIFVGTLKDPRGGELSVQRVKKMSELSGSEAATLLSKWKAGD